MKKANLEFEGKSLEGFYEKVGQEIWVHLNGKTFKYEKPSSLRSKNQNKKSLNPDEILATMPGKITSIKKLKGESVSSGETVVVMEAMKMEYSLNANKQGVIEEILVREGDQVALGQCLVRIKD